MLRKNDYYVRDSDGRGSKESGSHSPTPQDWDKVNWENVAEAAGKLRMKKVLKYIPSNGLHLDVGTGRGDGTRLVSQKKKTIGIDFGWRSLKIARRVNGNLVQADARNLPFRSGVFRSVTFLDVIEHVPGPEKALREINRVLQPGGCLVLQTPTVELTYVKTVASKSFIPVCKAYSALKRVKRAFLNRSEEKVAYYPQPYDQCMPVRKIRDILALNNFKIETEKTVNYWHVNPIIRVFSFAKLFLCTKSGGFG